MIKSGKAHNVGEMLQKVSGLLVFEFLLSWEIENFQTIQMGKTLNLVSKSMSPTAYRISM